MTGRTNLGGFSIWRFIGLSAFKSRISQAIGIGSAIKCVPISRGERNAHASGPKRSSEEGDSNSIRRMSTAYHAKYFAFELTKRCASDSMEKLAASLADAQVDLNPHQVEAALFAFPAPIERASILADEVGLGKTIEAGILLSQKWAE